MENLKMKSKPSLQKSDNSKNRITKKATRPAKTPHISVDALTHDSRSNTCKKLITYDNVEGKRCSMLVAPSVVDKAGRLMDTLIDAGCPLPRRGAMRDRLIRRLQRAVPKKIKTVVSQVGWHDGRYVLGTEIMGAKADTLLFNPLDPDRTANFELLGTLDEWKRTVAAPAAASDILMFCICAALSAPLLTFAKIGNRSFHLVGPTSIGKTTALRVTNSVVGRATLVDQSNWNDTIMGQHEIALGHNDSVFCIDESGHLTDKRALKLREASFNLAGGKIRVRSRASQNSASTNSQDATFNVITLSTGEEYLSQLSSERLAGERIRFIDVPALRSRKFGIFRNLPDGYQTSRAAIDALDEACAKHHGSAIRAWITYLLAHQERLPQRIRKLMQSFKEKVKAPTTGRDERFADGFALTYAAGVIAAKNGILPWRVSEIREAIRRCYRAARTAARSPDQQLKMGLRQLRHHLESPAIVSKKRFNSLPVAKQQRIGGFRITDANHGRYYAIKAQAFHRWFDSRDMAERVLKKLDADDQLIRVQASNVRTRPVKIAGVEGRARYYCVRKDWSAKLS
jgi:putative DNA primase/helicase